MKLEQTRKAIRYANLAANHVPDLIADMLDGDHPDNRVLLGTVYDGKKEIQIQLFVTQDVRQMIDDHGCAIHIDSIINQ